MVNCSGLLLLRTGRFAGCSRSTGHGLAGIVLQSLVLASDAISKPAVILVIEWAARLPVDLAIEVRHILLTESLQRLIRRRDQLTAIGRRIVDELPLVVFVLVIELADRGIFADAGNADNGSTTESCTCKLVAGGRAPGPRRIRFIR